MLLYKGPFVGKTQSDLIVVKWRLQMSPGWVRPQWGRRTSSSAAPPNLQFQHISKQSEMGTHLFLKHTHMVLSCTDTSAYQVYLTRLLRQSCQHYDFSSKLRFFQHSCDFSTILFLLPAIYYILSTIPSFVPKLFPPTSLINSLKTVPQFSKYCTGQLSRTPN